jgi:Zn-dependent peptidase ImmA (M78 family)/transcriptional regulator with XRE-family HTH domain
MGEEHRGGRRSLPRPIPERIKEAREGRGFTSGAFAEALGVTPQAISQYETGQTVPSGEVLNKIIRETAQPLPFFTTIPSRPGESRTPFWRSLKRMEQHHRRRILRRLQWAGDIAHMVERFIELPRTNLPQLDFCADTAGNDEIELAAERARDFWGLGRGPIRGLSSILESNGTLIIRERVFCPDMDAVSSWIGGRPFILLSDEVTSGPRDLFNLVHEVGHLVLHAGIEIDVRNIDKVEKQANRFAGAFLLPRERFGLEVLGTSLGYFRSLKERWGVAIAAMAYRCRDLQLITDNQFSYLFRQMNAQKIRKVEPLDDKFPVNRPAALAEAMHMLVEHGVHTRDQIEATLGLNMRDVESLCGIEAGYLDRRVVTVQFRPKIIPE